MLQMILALQPRLMNYSDMARKDELIPTRASLLKRCKNWEDRSSWQEFFDTYWKLIYGFARKSGLSDAEAQDVVQETMFAVSKEMPTFDYDPKRSFKAYLLNQTRWQIVNQFRKRGRHVDLNPSGALATGRTRRLEQIPNSATAALDKLWEAEWENNLLEAALAKVKRRLDPQKYQIFDFYVNKGWPAEKVATKFQVSINQVHLAKHRITESIRAEVQRLERHVV